jgi:hypothetical protein
MLGWFSRSERYVWARSVGVAENLIDILEVEIGLVLGVWLEVREGHRDQGRNSGREQTSLGYLTWCVKQYGKYDKNSRR